MSPLMSISIPRRKDRENAHRIVVASTRLKCPVNRLRKGQHVVINEQILVWAGVHGIERSLRFRQVRAHNIEVSQLNGVGVLHNANKAGEQAGMQVLCSERSGL